MPQLRSTDGTLTVPAHLCGPPGIANGGVTCSLFADSFRDAVEVTLHAAVPLEQPLELHDGPGATKILRALGEEADLATARAATIDFEPPRAPTLEQAEAAAQRFPRFEDHPFPKCLVCGPERQDGDGLRIFTGPVDRSPLYAAPWRPHAIFTDDHGHVRPEIVWGALDCPGAFAVNEPPRGVALLGRMTGRINAPVPASSDLIVVGWPIASGERKLVAGTAVYCDGEPLALARAVWILRKES